MDIIKGTAISSGRASGKVHIYEGRSRGRLSREKTDPASEKERYLSARLSCSERLKRLEEKAQLDNEAEKAAILRAHRLILLDNYFTAGITSAISEDNLAAEEAVLKSSKVFEDTLASLPDEYLKERACDIRDVTEMLTDALSEDGLQSGDCTGPFVLFAEDLTPGEAAALRKDSIIAAVLSKGSSLSHTAVILRGMGVPCVIKTGISIMSLKEGSCCVVDADNSRVILDPDKDILSDEAERRAHPRKVSSDVPVHTSGGKRVMLYANITGPEDVPAVLESGCDGIGLYRTEFLYLERKSCPDEDEQFEIYRDILLKMGGRRVVFRTADLGGDKSPSYMKLPGGKDPAPGQRGIRVSLSLPELFKAQLRALLRASAFGTTAIMFPMIASVSELKRAKMLLDEARDQLRCANAPYGSPEVGVMIETPAAVMTADLIADEADFFSIGTNDLAQYTYASGRGEDFAEKYISSGGEALLRMIEHTCSCAHDKGISCCICGELAADTAFTKRLICSGADSLSASSTYLPALRHKIMET